MAAYQLKDLISLKTLKLLKIKEDKGMRELLGIDIGNHDIKPIGEEYKQDPSKVISILNMVSQGKDRRTYGKKSAKNLINLLDVTIESPALEDYLNNSRWFVGGLAFKEGGRLFKPTRDTKKAENPTTIIHLLTAAAFKRLDLNCPKKRESVAISTLLPTEEYWDEKTDYVKILEDKLKKGEHKVKFNDSAFNGAEIELNIEHVLINPEGAVGQIACTYDWDGRIKQGMENDKYKTIANINIGSIDTNVAILQNEEFIDKGNFGIKGGTTEVLRAIAIEIKDNYGGEKIDPHKIDFHLRTETPLFVGDEEVKDLKDIAGRKYIEAAWRLADDLTREFEDRNIDKFSISKVNLCGGGAAFFKKGIMKHFITGKTALNVPKNPRYINAEGALKALIFELQESDKVNDEVFSEDK